MIFRALRQEGLFLLSLGAFLVFLARCTGIVPDACPVDPVSGTRICGSVYGPDAYLRATTCRDDPQGESCKFYRSLPKK
jgi:hypothetical protein